MITKTLKQISYAVSAFLSLLTLLCTAVGVHAAGTASFSLSPSSGSYNNGDSFSVTINVNSTDVINAVEADLNYNQSQLQFISIDSSGSGFDVPASASGGSGHVAIAKGSFAGVSGTNKVASVSFKVLTGGVSTSISFATSSEIDRKSDNANVWNGSTTGGTYSLVTPVVVTPPTPDTQAPSATTGLKTTAQTTSTVALGWNTSTDNTAVTGYKVYKNGAAIATVSGTSYTATGLAAQTTYNFQVSAVDAAGNESAKSSVLPAKTAAPAAAPANNTSSPTKPKAPAPSAPAPVVADQPVVVQKDISNAGYLVGIQVTDAKNKGVKDATVELGNATVKSDASGLASFSGVVAGVYTVNVKSGNTKMSRSVTVEEGDTTAVQTFSFILPKSSISKFLLPAGIAAAIIALAVGGFYAFNTARSKGSFIAPVLAGPVTAGNMNGPAPKPATSTQNEPALIRPTSGPASDGTEPKQPTES